MDAHGNPIVAPGQAPAPAQAAAGQALVFMNQLRMTFSSLKVDIPLFYWDAISTKFTLDRIKIAFWNVSRILHSWDWNVH